MKACNDINRMDGFPSVEEAYVEARRSYQPRASYNWSHPIVYFVGKKIGWNIINEKDSKENFNTFKHIFNALKIQAIEGKEFKIKQSKVLNDRKPLNPDLFKKLREKHKV